MHSAALRSDDFTLQVDGNAIDHAEFFAEVGTAQRVGLVAPNRVDGVGAVTLVLAYVTAFYNNYRAAGCDFFAYPDYFSLQGEEPVASYRMFDIWPPHKDAFFGRNAQDRLNAIIDRGINVLIVPDGDTFPHDYDRAALESARRNIGHCFVYAFDGRVQSADVIIEVSKEPLYDWAETVFETPLLSDQGTIQTKKAAWQALHQHSKTLKQSFRRVSLESALGRL